MEKKGEIVVYQPDAVMRLEVRVLDESVWLTQAQIAELFGTKCRRLALPWRMTGTSTCRARPGRGE